MGVAIVESLNKSAYKHSPGNKMWTSQVSGLPSVAVYFHNTNLKKSRSVVFNCTTSGDVKFSKQRITSEKATFLEMS